jgi:hypothetical protein
MKKRQELVTDEQWELIAPLHRVPPGWLVPPSKNTVLTHRLLALRHVTPCRLLRGNLRLPRGNLLKAGG